MSTNNFNRSDLYKIYNIVQSSMITYPKEIILANMRDFFSKDSYYRYLKDEWGFPNTVDHTNLPLGAGMRKEDLSTTRLYIGENYRHDGIFYPAILIKNNGAKYVPISINREAYSIKYAPRIFEDGYGNRSVFQNPQSYIFAGVWEGSVAIDIYTRSLRVRDELTDLVSMCLTDVCFKSLEVAGVVVKPIQVGSPSEQDDRNDKLYRVTLTTDVRHEWRREIPVANIVQAITFSLDFQNIENNFPVANNLGIRTQVTWDDVFKNI